jgi:Uma2 family endonuclease
MSTIDEPLVELDENADIPPHPGRRMSEEEFVVWSGDFWAEWVDGEVVMMMAVNREHAFLHSFLYRLVGAFVEQGDLGLVLSEPFQIRLGEQRRRRSPDVFFIAKERAEIIHKQEAEGAPDLAIEIVSPDSEARDWREKYQEYEAAGMREYWIIDPASEKIEAYSLQQGRFAAIAEQDGKIVSAVLPGFYLRPAWVRQGKLPRVHEAMREFES